MNLELAREKLRDIQFHIEPESIVECLRTVIEIVEIARIPKKQQDAAVAELLREIIVDAPITDQREKLLLDMVDAGIVTHLSQVIHAAARGELKIESTFLTIKTAIEAIGPQRILKCVAPCWQKNPA